MRIIFVRHGDPDYANDTLTEKGWREAALLAERVSGHEPKPEDIDLDGSGVTVETLKELLTLDAKSWRENCAGIREYFEQFGDKLPHELREELEALEKAFAE